MDLSKSSHTKPLQKESESNVPPVPLDLSKKVTVPTNDSVTVFRASSPLDLSRKTPFGSTAIPQLHSNIDGARSKSVDFTTNGISNQAIPHPQSSIIDARSNSVDLAKNDISSHPGTSGNDVANDDDDDDVIVVGVQRARHSTQFESTSGLRFPVSSSSDAYSQGRQAAVFNMSRQRSHSGGLGFSPHELSSGLVKLKQALLMAKDPEEAKVLAHNFQRLALQTLLKTRMQQQKHPQQQQTQQLRHQMQQRALEQQQKQVQQKQQQQQQTQQTQGYSTEQQQLLRQWHQEEAQLQKQQQQQPSNKTSTEEIYPFPQPMEQSQTEKAQEQHKEQQQHQEQQPNKQQDEQQQQNQHQDDTKPNVLTSILEEPTSPMQTNTTTTLAKDQNSTTLESYAMIISSNATVQNTAAEKGDLDSPSLATAVHQTAVVLDGCGSEMSSLVEGKGKPEGAKEKTVCGDKTGLSPHNEPASLSGISSPPLLTPISNPNITSILSAKQLSAFDQQSDDSAVAILDSKVQEIPNPSSTPQQLSASIQPLPSASQDQHMTSVAPMATTFEASGISTNVFFSTPTNALTLTSRKSPFSLLQQSLTNASVATMTANDLSSVSTTPMNVSGNSGPESYQSKYMEYVRKKNLMSGGVQVTIDGISAHNSLGDSSLASTVVYSTTTTTQTNGDSLYQNVKGVQELKQASNTKTNSMEAVNTIGGSRNIASPSCASMPESGEPFLGQNASQMSPEERFQRKRMFLSFLQKNPHLIELAKENPAIKAKLAVLGRSVGFMGLSGADSSSNMTSQSGGISSASTLPSETVVNSSMAGGSSSTLPSSSSQKRIMYKDLVNATRYAQRLAQVSANQMASSSNQRGITSTNQNASSTTARDLVTQLSSSSTGSSLPGAKGTARNLMANLAGLNLAVFRSPPPAHCKLPLPVHNKRSYIPPLAGMIVPQFDPNSSTKNSPPNQRSMRDQTRDLLRKLHEQQKLLAKGKSSSLARSISETREKQLRRFLNDGSATGSLFTGHVNTTPAHSGNKANPLSPTQIRQDHQALNSQFSSSSRPASLTTQQQSGLLRQHISAQAANMAMKDQAKSTAEIGHNSIDSTTGCSQQGSGGEDSHTKSSSTPSVTPYTISPHGKTMVKPMTPQLKGWTQSSGAQAFKHVPVANVNPFIHTSPDGVTFITHHVRKPAPTVTANNASTSSSTRFPNIAPKGHIPNSTHVTITPSTSGYTILKETKPSTQEKDTNVEQKPLICSLTLSGGNTDDMKPTAILSVTVPPMVRCENEAVAQNGANSKADEIKAILRENLNKSSLAKKIIKQQEAEGIDAATNDAIKTEGKPEVVSDKKRTHKIKKEKKRKGVEFASGDEDQHIELEEIKDVSSLTEYAAKIKRRHKRKRALEREVDEEEAEMDIAIATSLLSSPKKRRRCKDKDSQSLRHKLRYNKNAKYEAELIRDEERKLFNRVRRVAKHHSSQSEQEDGGTEEGQQQLNSIEGLRLTVPLRKMTLKLSRTGVYKRKVGRPRKRPIPIASQATRHVSAEFEEVPVTSGVHRKFRRRGRKRWYKKRPFYNMAAAPVPLLEDPLSYEIIEEQQWEPYLEGEGELLDLSMTQQSSAILENQTASFSLPADDNSNLDLLAPPEAVIDPALFAELKGIVVCRETGETKLHRLTRMGHEDLAVRAIEAGLLDVNVRDHAGYTALHESCATGRHRVAVCLLQHGADVNAAALDGTRPIHDAVDHNRIELVRILFAAGADPRLTTYSGKTLLRIARTEQMRTLIQGYCQDLNGIGPGQKNEGPWEFGITTTALDGILTIYIFIYENTDLDILTDVPSDSGSECDDIDLELCDVIETPYPVWRICLDPTCGPRNYHRLSDLARAKGLAADDFLILNSDLTFIRATEKEALETHSPYISCDGASELQQIKHAFGNRGGQSGLCDYRAREHHVCVFVESNSVLSGVMEKSVCIMSAIRPEMTARYKEFSPGKSSQKRRTKPSEKKDSSLGKIKKIHIKTKAVRILDFEPEESSPSKMEGKEVKQKGKDRLSRKRKKEKIKNYSLASGDSTTNIHYSVAEHSSNQITPNTCETQNEAGENSPQQQSSPCKEKKKKKRGRGLSTKEQERMRWLESRLQLICDGSKYKKISPSASPKVVLESDTSRCSTPRYQEIPNMAARASNTKSEPDVKITDKNNENLQAKETE